MIQDAQKESMEEICAADKDDLVILVGHLPDRDEAVLFSYDCILSQELGVRSAKAAGNVKFLSVLWYSLVAIRS